VVRRDLPEGGLVQTQRHLVEHRVAERGVIEGDANAAQRPRDPGGGMERQAAFHRGPHLGAADALEVFHKSAPLGAHNRPEALHGSQGLGVRANHFSLPLKPRLKIAFEGDELRDSAPQRL
jgi:hypothetical protein